MSQKSYEDARRRLVSSLRWLAVVLLILGGELFVFWIWESSGVPSWARR